MARLLQLSIQYCLQFLQRYMALEINGASESELCWAQFSEKEQSFKTVAPFLRQYWIWLVAPDNASFGSHLTVDRKPRQNEGTNSAKKKCANSTRLSKKMLIIRARSPCTPRRLSSWCSCSFFYNFSKYFGRSLRFLSFHGMFWKHLLTDLNSQVFSSGGTPVQQKLYFSSVLSQLHFSTHRQLDDSMNLKTFFSASKSFYILLKSSKNEASTSILGALFWCFQT